MKMLCYSEPELIQLFPAKPDSWKQGSIEGMALRGGITIERLEWNGKNVSVRIRSMKAQKLKICHANKVVRTVALRANSPVTLIIS